ncbi:putative ABC transporter, ATP-binding protein [Desulfonema limicola]|uniref:ABC transporter, ATP-binding protein n=1 Tax=Desulfonema limicola TaxID=45656 RepID=A0A975BBX4_9BACT|nr:ABC transporter ATP-binding protein [Desulfonema limicola]QTA82538.1 putative ABC transporter, ATP-binding protein [Desulfonema limicola]
MSSRQALIDLKGVSFGYPGSKLILDKLDLTLNSGDRIGLLGPNGSGKTTLFHIIMGLLKPIEGKIEILGKPAQTQKDFREVYKKVGLLFQDADDQLFSPTVLEDVAFGPLNLGKSKQDAVRIAEKTLDYLGLSGFEHRITHKLSGGEKRLVSLAAVLAMEPEVLLMDEPSTGLDDPTKRKLTEVLNHLDLSYILISHESEFMAGITHSMYMMENGKIRTDIDMRYYIHAHPHTCHQHF